MFKSEPHMAPLELSLRPRHDTPVSQPRARPLSLHIHKPDDPTRIVVESYIQLRYRQRFGASLRAWLPTLVSIQEDGDILAAAGYRDGNDRLFLERYLDAPVERYLCDQDAPVARNRIVEVGQFATVRPGTGRLLVPLLIRHLREQGFDWAVSTLTTELHHLLARMGVLHRPLSVAAAEYLSDQERSDWGNYYAHAPHVFVGRLDAIEEHFQEHEV